MLLEKLADGVLELDTPIGPRYVEPTFLQRVYLIWTFRNFFSLPQQVLRASEIRLIEQLCNENRFVSRRADGLHERPVIGRVERRLAAQAPILPMRKPATSAPGDVREPGREAASA